MEHRLIGSETVPPSINEKLNKLYFTFIELNQSFTNEFKNANHRRFKKNLQIEWNPKMPIEEFSRNVISAYSVSLPYLVSENSSSVFCFNCNTDSCEHSTTINSGEVFAGYQDTGRPLWLEFFNYLLLMGDKRIDLLFSQRAPILALVVTRKKLIENQLHTYGRNTTKYRIVGQVVAGYFDVKGRRFAITVQIIDVARRNLIVNVVARPEVKEFVVGEYKTLRNSAKLPYKRVFNALKQIKLRVEDLNRDWCRCRTKQWRRTLENKVFSLLRHFASSVEQKGRQNVRRTSHAEGRSYEKRPVHKAYEDISDASSDSFYKDNLKDSIVVTAKNGRSHVFARNGRHITSLIITTDRLVRLQSRKRYTLMTESEVNLFRSKISDSTGENTCDD